MNLTASFLHITQSDVYEQLPRKVGHSSSHHPELHTRVSSSVPVLWVTHHSRVTVASNTQTC
jgi:hypothetical protein